MTHIVPVTSTPTSDDMASQGHSPLYYYSSLCGDFMQPAEFWMRDGISTLPPTFPIL